MNRKILWVFAIVISAIFSQITFADNKSINSDSDSKSNSLCSSLCTCSNNFFNKLNLNPEQSKKVKAIRKQFDTTRVAKEKELLSIHKQIEAIVNVDNLDEAKLDILLNQKKNIMVVLIKNRILERHHVYNVLTPQQKIKYNQMVNDWEKARSEKLNSTQKS